MPRPKPSRNKRKRQISNQLRWQILKVAEGRCSQCGGDRGDSPFEGVCTDCGRKRRDRARFRTGFKPWRSGGPGRPPKDREGFVKQNQQQPIEKKESITTNAE